MAAGTTSIVTLNVGGRKFSSSRDTVCKVRYGVSETDRCPPQEFAKEQHPDAMHLVEYGLHFSLDREDMPALKGSGSLWAVADDRLVRMTRCLYSVPGFQASG